MSGKFLPHSISALLPHPHYMTKRAVGEGKWVNIRKTRSERMSLNTSPSSREQAPGKGLHLFCPTRRIGYIALVFFDIQDGIRSRGV